jgi:hypothetical protein
MAVAYDSVCPDTASGSSATELTSGAWTISGSDRVVLGVIATGDVTGQNPSNMDHPTAGGALTQAGSTVSLGTHGKLSLWRRVAPTTGSNTSHGAWAASQGENCIGLVSYTGVDQTTPLGTPATANANISGPVASFTATVNITTVVGDTVFAVAFFHETSTNSVPQATPAGGSTGRYEVEGAQMGGFGAVQCIELVATGTTTTMSVDFTGTNMRGDWGMIAVVLHDTSFSGPRFILGTH